MKSLFKKIYKKYFKPKTLKIINGILQDNLIVASDVGAANGLPAHWQILEGMVKFYNFEPHPESYKNLIQKYELSPYKHLFKTYNIGLSEHGGNTILYALNAPTGSSIMPLDYSHPEVEANNSYIFPIAEIEIETSSLQQILDKENEAIIDLIKLDVQGAELLILKGLDNYRLQNLLVAEIEVGMKSIYKGAPTLQDAVDFFKKYNLVLYDMNLVNILPALDGDTDYMYNYFNINYSNKTVIGQLHEFDLIFMRDPMELLKSKNNDTIRKMITLFCTYKMFANAQKLLIDARKLEIFSEIEFEAINISIMKWYSKFVRPNVFLRMMDFCSDKLKYLGSFTPYKA